VPAGGGHNQRVSSREELLRTVGWVVGGLGALSGLVGPVLAKAPDSTSLVGVVSGSTVCVLGAVIIDRRPANRATWAFLAGGLLLVAVGLCYGWAAGRIRGGDLGGAVGTVASLAEVIGALAGAGLPLFQFLFPDGRLPSRRWRPVFVGYLVGWLACGVAVAVVLLPRRDPAILADMGPVPPHMPSSLAPALAVISATEVFAAAAMLAGVAAVVVRLRGARGQVRQQVLFVLWGLGLTVVLIAGTALSHGLGWYPVEDVVALFAPVPFIVSVTVAMRRHRLFDVDRLVGRTITYVATTTVLVGLYVGVAVGLGALAARLGLGSALPVAAATLAVAAAFRPLLRFVRGQVDRRFDRRTWLAVRVLDDFTAGLRTGSVSPADLVSALRRAVDDPTAAVAYVDGGRTIALDGSPLELGPARPGRLRRPVSAGGAPVAVLDLDGRLGQEPRLLDTALSAAALPLENAALHARTAVNLAEVAASRSRIVAAEDANRRQIERDLHDGAQQRLVALALRLRVAERDLAPTDRGTAEVLADAVAELRGAVTDLRELTRGMLPPVLTDEGLDVALRTAVARLPLPVVLDVPGDRLPAAVEATAWYVACEGMTNAAKHAGATAVHVSLRRSPSEVTLVVADDGAGGAVIAPGGGIQGLADRVAANGGRLDLTSPPGAGTRIEVVLPCVS
jgi:signal transduction histidine kinase